MKVQPKIELIATIDDEPINGNAIDSGDKNYDLKVENELIDRLNSGDVWAWASVEVKASFGGLSGSAYLGCCSYKDEKEFLKDPYYKDMVKEATEELKIELESLQGIEII